MINQRELSQALSVLLKMQPRGKLAQYMEKVTGGTLWAFKSTGQTQSLSLSTSGSGCSSQPRLQHPFCLCAAMLIPCWWWTKPLKLWACPQLNDFCYKSCRVVAVLEQWLQHSDMVVPLYYSGGGLKTWVFNTQHWLSLWEGSCGVSPGLCFIVVPSLDLKLCMTPS